MSKIANPLERGLPRGFSKKTRVRIFFFVFLGLFLFVPMFTELRAHTAFSFGDGAVSPEALARRARQLGYTHLGITDCADLGGIAKFAVEAMAPTKDPSARASPSTSSWARAIARSVSGPCNRSSARRSKSTDIRPRSSRALPRAIRISPRSSRSLASASGGAGTSPSRASAADVPGSPGSTSPRMRGLHALTGPANGPLASRVRAGDQ